MLSDGWRIENGTALLAVLLSSLGGKKRKLEDFLPKRKSQADQKEGSIADIMNILKG